MEIIYSIALKATTKQNLTVSSH